MAELNVYQQEVHLETFCPYELVWRRTFTASISISQLKYSPVPSILLVTTMVMCGHSVKVLPSARRMIDTDV